MKNEVLSNGGIAELKFQSVTLRGVCMIVNKLSCLTRSKFPYQRNNLSPLLFVQLRIKLSTNSPLSPLSRAFPPSVLIKASCDEQLIVEKKQKKKKKRKTKERNENFPCPLWKRAIFPSNVIAVSSVNYHTPLKDLDTRNCFRFRVAFRCH